MIDHKVEILAAEFVSTAEKISLNPLVYQFDASIMSIPFLDFILNPKFKAFSTTSRKKLILQASAYLSLVCLNYWEKISPKIEINILVLGEEEKEEVVIKINSGPLISNEPVLVNLTKAISLNLKNEKDRPQYMGQEYLPIGLEEYKLSYIAAGIISCLSPFFEGSWKNLAEDSIGAILNQLYSRLADDISLWLKNRNPNQSKLFSEEIIYPYLCPPPMGYKEELLGLRSTIGFHEVLETYNLNNKEAALIGIELLETPHITTASLGYIFSSALEPNLSKISLFEFSQCNPILAAKLRPAIETFRDLRGLKASWLQYNNAEQASKKVSCLLQDHEAGAYPLLLDSSASLVCNIKYQVYLEAICANLANHAYNLGSILKEKTDNPVSFLLQHIYLTIKIRKLEESRELIDNAIEIPKESQENLFMRALKALIELLSESTIQTTTNQLQNYISLIGEVNLGRNIRHEIISLSAKKLIATGEIEKACILMASFPEILTSELYLNYLRMVTLLSTNDLPKTLKVPQIRKSFWSPYYFYSSFLEKLNGK